MTANEAFTFSNVGAGVSTAAFSLLGGAYAVSVLGTFGGGTVKLQQLGADATTWLDQLEPFNNAGTEVDLVISSWSAAGVKQFYLAAGSYRFTTATASAVYASIARAPLA